MWWDTGSSDRTVELAQQAGGQVYHFPWVGDFSPGPEFFPFPRPPRKYCLWMDADDVLDAQVPSRLASELKAALPPQTDVVMLPYHTAFDQAGAPPSPITGSGSSGGWRGCGGAALSTRPSAGGQRGSTG